jgi:hypothetical protein
LPLSLWRGVAKVPRDSPCMALWSVPISRRNSLWRGRPSLRGYPASLLTFHHRLLNRPRLYVPPPLVSASCFTAGASIPGGVGLAFIVAGEPQVGQSFWGDRTLPCCTGFPVPSHTGHSTLMVPSPSLPVPLQFSQMSPTGVFVGLRTTVPAVASTTPSHSLAVHAQQHD